MKNDEYYMQIAYKEALKAYKKGEIPVGAIVVSNNDGKIISKAHNLRDNSQVITKHAEIIAIEKANKKIKNWRLINCTLYTTLKPCRMCQEVIKSSKLEKVVYSSESNNDLILKTKMFQINSNIIITNTTALIKKAFLKIREKYKDK